MAQKKKPTKRKTTAKKAPAKKKATSKRRTTATKAKAKAPAPKKAPVDAPKPGTTLKRTFKGKAYELKVTADGYTLGDMRFRSLTAAAKAITGYPSISGPRFFGTDDASQKDGAK